MNDWPEWLTASLVAAGLDPDHIRDVVRSTLAEDLQWGPDVTSDATLPASQQATADVVSRQAGCLAGVPVGAAAVFELAHQRGDNVDVTIVRGDGVRVQPGDVVMTVTGPIRCVLTSERTMLNLMSQLSGVASATAAWVDALADTTTKVRDTRKTVPGMRVLQKYAVRCGGGVNHRMGLGDAALIKDNHVAAAGSVSGAFRAVKAARPDIHVEVECDSVAQVREAVDAGAELVLLDNMTPGQLRECVAIASARGVRTEASGGITLPHAHEVAETGVDFIAVGALTHSAPVLDLGLDVRLP